MVGPLEFGCRRFRGVSHFDPRKGDAESDGGDAQGNAAQDRENIARGVAGRFVVIGEDAGNIEAQLGGATEIVRGTSMQDAVARAFSQAKSGDVVLLAPACASFDMFKSFEERGAVFKKSVTDLKTSTPLSIENAAAPSA